MEIRDPVSELKETELYKRLEVLDATYAERAVKFLRQIAPILATTARYFPYYTRHDAHHGFHVITRVAQAIKPECLLQDTDEALTAPELYLIILSAYAHDLGMTVFPGEDDNLRMQLGLADFDEWQVHSTLQRHLRGEHSKRGGTYIAAHAEQLGVPVPLVDALDKMMRAHNLSIEELDIQIPETYAAEERPINVRQLAIILCVADALEFSDTRVVDGVLDQIASDPSPAARTSYLENMKHVCVGGSLAIDRDGCVLVSGTFHEADVLALAHRTFDQMEAWLKGYCDLDRRLKPPRLRIRADPFARNLAFTAGRFERLGVRLNTRNVIDLIASNAVWQQNTALAVRELIQNAVEACRYRRHHASPADAYEPRVNIVFDRAQNEIVVEDNGCGMSDRVVLNNLLTIGSSRATEPGYHNDTYAPIARFGIGFWSVFTLAHSACVETAEFEPHRGNPNKSKTAEGIKFDVSLNELNNYTVFRPIVRPCGTKIVLQLKDGISLDDVYVRSREQIFCSEIPVHFRLEEEEHALSETLPPVPIRQLLGARTAILVEHDIKLFEWSDKLGATELSLLIAYRMEGGKPTFLVQSGSSLLTVLPSIRQPKTGVCGFSAPLRARHLCIDLLRVGTYMANRTTPEGIAFSLDRTKLIVNPTAQSFENEITDLVHKGYRAFLRATGGDNLDTVARLRTEARMHGGNVYDQFTGSELFEAARRFPDLAPLKLQPVSGGEAIHVRADELQSIHGKVLSAYRPGLDEDVLEMIAKSAGLNAIQSGTSLGAVGQTLYFMAPDRTASWLFDADPASSVVFFDTRRFGLVPIQIVDLDRVDASQPAHALAEVTGRWSGGIYLRSFDVPGSKPYIFLGRYRVLIKKSTKLAIHIEDLIMAGRHSKAADLISELAEDEAGYTSPDVAQLL